MTEQECRTTKIEPQEPRAYPQFPSRPVKARRVVYRAVEDFAEVREDDRQALGDAFAKT